MSGNPLISQGTLNKLKGAILIPGFTSLNVTASYLTKAGIKLSFNGEATVDIDTMTGVVKSPEPYLKFSLEFDAVKTNGFAQLWRNQMESNTLLGDISVVPDTTGLTNYNLSNASIASIGELPFDGTSNAYAVTLTGVYYINSAMWI